MDFPAFPVIAIEDKARITKALKKAPTEIYTSGESIMAVFEDPEIIYHMAPDLELIKAFKNQVEGKGFSLVECLSMCPTNWRVDPQTGCKFVEEEMIPVFPLGNFRDR